MKLKTLEDFGTGNIFVDKVQFKQLLRQEAIRWIRELKSRGTLGDLNSQDNHFKNMANKSQIDWIKQFFNITDSDLKKEYYKIQKERIKGKIR